jgi:hypothetical protein
MDHSKPEHNRNHSRNTSGQDTQEQPQQAGQMGKGLQDHNEPQQAHNRPKIDR